MHISKIQLTDFKRFSDLTIDLSNIQSPPKLVLLIGANGSGKSSIFDAFNWIAHYKKMILAPADMWLQIVPIDEPPSIQENSLKTYFGKANKEPKISISFDEDLLIENSWDSDDNILFKDIEKTSSDLFYGRSALRQAPRLNKNPFGSMKVLDDADRPAFYIDAENRLGNDVSTLLKSGQNIEESFVLPLNNAFKNIFGENDLTSLKLIGVSSKEGEAPIQIIFEKGQSTFDYNLLSSGEKEIFGILLNLLVRRESFQNTIYFIDELDVHLNTSLQYALLKEITENWIPESCQLWAATHSLGFIKYARESENAVILDFDRLDFDLPQIIIPQAKETLEVFEIAVPKEVVFQIFDGKQIILCENKDDDLYNLINLENKIFVGVQNKDQVFRNIKSNPNYFGLIDRDYLTDNEINTLQARYPNLFILDFYNFENYVYHPENIKEVLADFSTETYKQSLAEQKKSQFNTILLNLKPTKKGYKILIDKNLSGEIDSIVQSLESDNFSDFYKFFNMKNTNHSFLDANKITKKQLAKTNWFREKINQILNRPRQNFSQK